MSGDQRVAHVLSRLTFGARPGDFGRVKKLGVDAFIAQQLDPDSIDDSALLAKLGKLPTLAMATPVIIEQYTPPKPAAVASPSPTKSADTMTGPPPNAAGRMEANKTTGEKTSGLSTSETIKAPEAMQKPGDQKPEISPPATAASKPLLPPKNPQMVVTELQRAKLLRAVYGERQLYELMVDFWENHFSIFVNKDADRYLLTSFDRDTIRPFAMGRFRDLLGATAHSPAMLFYLDNWTSSIARNYPATPDKPARTVGGINENYARELLELHTMGVDGGYTQKDVQEVARCFTGWTIQKPNEEGLFLFRPGAHDSGEKTVLGHKIPSGGGIGDAEQVLDLLATHPATAHFIATKLARRFVSDDPPQSVINRAAEVFLKTDGSIRETLRAIITSPEFFSAASYRTKMRSPFEYAAAALRVLNAQTDGDRAALDAITRMGQPIFGRLTPDGYIDRAEQWLSSGTMLQRFNFASALATNRLKGTRIDPTQLLSGSDPTNKEEVAAQLMRLIVAGDVSAETRAALEKTLREAAADARLASMPATSQPIGYTAKGSAQQPAPTMQVPVYVSELITLLVGSPEFQKR